MKNLTWILFAVIFLASCANETSNNSEVQKEINDTTSTSEPKHYKASADAPLVGLWEVQFALGSGNVDKDALANEYVGRWLNLKPDNTFESGKWQESSNTGNWSYDAETKIVTIHYDKPETIGFEWRIQGKGDRMVWLGNTPNNKKGTQLSLNRATALPQKQ